MTRFAMRFFHCTLVATTVLLGGCATPRDAAPVPDTYIAPRVEPTSQRAGNDICHALRYHVLDFDGRGQISFPALDRDCFGDQQRYPEQCQDRAQASPAQITPDARLQCHLQAIRNNIAAGRSDGSRYDHIVVIVHGGLVAEETGLREAVTATRVMDMDCDSDSHDSCGHYYPIFVVWRSSALDTYAEQATRIEQGKRSSTFAPIVAPLTITSDIARGVVREPRFGASEGLRLWSSYFKRRLALGAGEFRCRDMKARMNASRLAFSDQPDKSLRIICPPIDESGDSRLRQGLTETAYVLSTPLRVVTTPILLGPGQSAWENMQRRARGLVWRETDHRDQTLPDVTPSTIVEGGIQYLFKDVLVPLTENRERTLTLIGHSMGSIVVTEMLKLYPELVFDNMVLMAAAVDMRSFVYALRAAREVRNGNARVYNLSLHPDNDVFELSGYGALPSGSLLQWIDEAYQMPPTQLDRVLGKWTNLPALERAIGPDVAPHITFKMFGFEAGEPQTHGAFNDIGMCYWRSAFWRERAWQKQHTSCQALLKESGEVE